MGSIASDILARINALAAEQFACYVVLEQLAQEHGDGERWDEVAAPTLDKLRCIQGQLWVAWEQRRRE